MRARVRCAEAKAGVLGNYRKYRMFITLYTHEILHFMSGPSEQSRGLAYMFDALGNRMHESTSLEERTELLRRMKVLSDKLTV